MHVIIPARYASTRLPGKPLVDVAGKPLIQRVYERARETGATSIVIATDDERIRATVQAFGGQVCMTRSDHRSGTDRLAEAIDKLAIAESDIVVNLQGDEPLMPPGLIRQVVQALDSRGGTHMATACHAIHDKAEFLNPNVVKVTFDRNGHALTFSRAPIPWPRDAMAIETSGPIDAYRHIGLYGYRAGFVRRYAAWPPCALEEAEQLEQLRVLWHGERIVVCVADESPGPGVDTPEELERVRNIFKNR
ncbi:MAG TPA: 3-deoxy-manno-octulosonate cytidylyltransferase [Burkholderiales bacterium]|nr:3-deoxy-manno-octulosonate cytidylyltransferase [Burkholderiales bacterium]